MCGERRRACATETSGSRQRQACVRAVPERIHTAVNAASGGARMGTEPTRLELLDLTRRPGRDAVRSYPPLPSRGRIRTLQGLRNTSFRVTVCKPRV